jgi:hypothetical protein
LSICHLRLEVLRDRGISEVGSLISTDSEAFTYNKCVNRIAIIQEHKIAWISIRPLAKKRPERLRLRFTSNSKHSSLQGRTESLES